MGASPLATVDPLCPDHISKQSKTAGHFEAKDLSEKQATNILHL